MIVRCRQCGVDLTEDLVQVITNDHLKETDSEDYILRGRFFVSDGEYYAGSEKQILINKADLKNAVDHSDTSRLGGCCGFAGLDGLNKLCINGHEIATERSDCWLAHSVMFDNDRIITDGVIV
jgi:hypothetical protein